MLRKTFFMAAICLCFGLTNVFAQTNPSADKRKIKVQLWVNGKLHPVNQTITKSDKDVRIRAYNAENNQELAVILVDAAVVRGGQKVNTAQINSGGSIEKLLLQAKNDDQIVFEIKQLYELAEDMSLKPFTSKSFKVSYLFFDAKLDSKNNAVLGSN